MTTKHGLNWVNSCAGGGTRTLKLSRARAPKTRAVANFATPAVPGDRTVTSILKPVGGLP